jgi:thiosulfate dehydrogenase [quinone] large subunit
VNDSSRRGFFLRIWQGLFGGAVATAAAPLLASCTRPAAKPAPASSAAVDVRGLAEGSSLVAPAPGPDGAPILIVRESGAQYHALSLLCTHEGCPVNPTPVKGILRCPCHGSQFDLDGHVRQGPAEFPLGRYNSEYNAKRHRLIVKFGPS